MSDARMHEVFVPGRVCLFGEHSDWAGGYRRINSALAPGQVIICGTNQGIHARCRKHPDSLVIHSSLPDGTRAERIVLPMDPDRLREVAAEGAFYSYAAGVAWYMCTFYHVEGLEINNYETTLPVKKGLSSSAAFCVLVARAFNRAYGLNMTIRAEIEAAYQGETLTPSRCGRMDQGCAYGQVPVHMTFDADMLTTNAVVPGGDFHLLVADLKGSKDTVRILADLNRSYPFAESEHDKGVQHYLGAVNTDIINRAMGAIDRGDAQALGELMTAAQTAFDENLMPASEELISPKLHKVLADPTIAQWTYGGKGVGSQGDGCVQLVAKSVDARSKLAEYLRTEYGMDCFDLDVKRPPVVRKAIIPVAGFGTRMFPAAKGVKKAFFPVATSDGMVKPVIQVIIEEAMSAGIDQVALVIQPEDEPLYRDYFEKALSSELLKKLPTALRKEAEKLPLLGQKIHYVHQLEQGGLGHAVHCAADWVGDDPFMVMLGDHLYRTHADVSCAQQVVDAFEAGNAAQSVTGVYQETLENVVHYGTVTGNWAQWPGRMLKVTAIAEKPTCDQAREFLSVDHLDDYLCVLGIYVFTPRLMTRLKEQIDDHQGEGEVQLTTAMDTLREQEGLMGLLVDGEHFDVGLPSEYVETLAEFSTADLSD